MDLRTALPQLLPRATAWAETQAAAIASSGRPLTGEEVALARRVGVADPDRVRVAVVDTFPMPDDPELRAAAMQTGLLGPGTLGLTLGYTVLISRGYETTRLLSHELRHVHQYEQAGSIARFLTSYLQQIVTDGYAAAPLELDARAHEIIDL